MLRRYSYILSQALNTRKKLLSGRATGLILMSSTAAVTFFCSLKPSVFLLSSNDWPYGFIRTSSMEDGASDRGTKLCRGPTAVVCHSSCADGFCLFSWRRDCAQDVGLPKRSLLFPGSLYGSLCDLPAGLGLRPQHMFRASISSRWRPETKLFLLSATLQRVFRPRHWRLWVRNAGGSSITFQRYIL